MTEIHVIHKKIGGVGHIAQLLENRGATVINARLNLSVALSAEKASETDTIFFHQPFSHLCCLFYALRNSRIRDRLCCVLHEASNYNVGATLFIRALLGTVVRLVVIWLCVLLGVRVRGVSKYVCSTYNLPGVEISYVQLFAETLARQPTSLAPKSNTAIVWLRRGDTQMSAPIIFRLCKLIELSEIVVLGDRSECDTFLKALELNHLSSKVIVATEKYKVSEQKFFHLLQSSKWFVSTYPREGFGLSAFQAAYFGCVVLAQRKGALVEWLPNENYVFLDKMLAGFSVDVADAKKISEVNSKFAHEYLIHEN